MMRSEDDSVATVDTTISLSNASVTDNSELQSCEWSSDASNVTLQSASPTPPPPNVDLCQNWSDNEVTYRASLMDSELECSRSTLTDKSYEPLLTSTPNKKRKTETPSTCPNQPRRTSPRVRNPPKRYSFQLFAMSTSSEADCDNCSTTEIGSTVTVLWQLTHIMKMDGCAENCVTMVHGLNEYDVLSAHYLFARKTQQEQSNWILEYFNLHCPCDTEGTKEIKNMAYMITGKTVCLTAWLGILSLSLSRFYRLRKNYLECGGFAACDPKRVRSLSPKTMEAVAWMKHYFERIGDKRPDKDGIYLPTCLTERKIYEVMTEELWQGDETRSICFSQFNKLYRSEFKNVSIPKEGRFTKCDFCTLIKMEMCKITSTKEEKAKLKQLLLDHLSIQEQERRRYYSNRQIAIEQPRDYLSIIVDGMDQNKTNIPSLVRVPKSCQNLWTLRTHLTGALVHGTGSYCYFDFLQWSHDCNLTLSSILLTLKELSKTRVLPARLLLQMDNCVRENKNKFVFGFLLLLIEKDIFAEIELGFLMVGHTHEDIDQHFSCLSRYLKKHSAVTIEDMEQATRASNHHVADVTTLTYMFDIRGWIAPHLDEIRYHTEPHIFHFKRCPTTGRAVMFYKHWSHNEWEPDGGILLLKSLPEPDSEPALVPPSIEKQDIQQLKRDLPKYDGTGVFSPDAKEKWETLLSGFSSRYGSLPDIKPSWMLDELKTLAERFTCDPNLPSIPDKILKKSQSTQECRKVEIGKRSKSSEKSKGAKKPRTTTEESGKEKEKSAPKQRVTFPSPTVGSFIALKCHKYMDYLPQIGKLQAMDDTSVTVEWLDGSYSGIWIFWKDHGTTIKESFPRRAVIGEVVLTPAMRIKKEYITLLKNEYTSAEFV